MTPKKRDEIMGCLLDPMNRNFSTSTREAVSECWSKAKAWNELRKWADGCRGPWTAEGFRKEMDTLIPPEPSTPLGKLGYWLNNEYSRQQIDLHTLHNKIAELMKEDERK